MDFTLINLAEKNSKKIIIGVFLLSGMHAHDPRYVRMVNAWVHAHAYAYAGSLGFRILFVIWSVIFIPRLLS